MTTKVTSSVLANTAVTPGIYGASNTLSTFTVDGQGRLTSAANISVSTITLSSGQITGLATSATTDTTNAANISAGTLSVLRLPTSGVTAGSSGNATVVPAITVDTYGRITSLTNTTISISTANVSGLAASATTDTTNANNILTGTLNSLRLPNSGVTAGSAGNSNTIPTITVDQYGRITSLGKASIAITTANVSGLATSATTDTTNATNIITGTLSSAILPSGVLNRTYATVNGGATTPLNVNNFEWTGIPSTAKNIQMIISELTMVNAGANLHLQLSSGATYPAAGSYTGAHLISGNGAAQNYLFGSVNAFLLSYGVGTLSTSRLGGIVTISNLTGNLWVISSGLYNTLAWSGGNGTYYRHTSGSITLSGTLDRIKLLSGDGSNFNGGNTIISYS